jgi:hypothetical protein
MWPCVGDTYASSSSISGALMATRRWQHGCKQCNKHNNNNNDEEDKDGKTGSGYHCSTTLLRTSTSCPCTCRSRHRHRCCCCCCCCCCLCSCVRAHFSLLLPPWRVYRCACLCRWLSAVLRVRRKLWYAHTQFAGWQCNMRAHTAERSHTRWMSRASTAPSSSHTTGAA